MSRTVCAVMGALLAASCFALGDGVEPPRDEIYYPVGVALGASGDRLYVASSDFDLQYNGGTVLVVDAVAVRELLPTWCRSSDDCSGSDTCAGFEGGLFGTCVDAEGSPCGALGERSAGQQAATPGRCEAVVLKDSDLVLDAVKTAPFATDIRYTQFADDAGKTRARLFLPVRGDASLHWLDVEAELGRGPVIECGQTTPGGACDEAHRIGNEDSERSAAGVKLPPEPSSLGVSNDGRSLIVGHQTWGKVSLFTNRDEGPWLEEVLEGLALNPMAAVALTPSEPSPGSRSANLSDFLVTYRHTETRPYVELLRAWAAPADGANAFLQRGGRSEITVSSLGIDSRGIAVDAFEQQQCAAACACAEDEPQCQACHKGCSKLPAGVYVAQRSPDALLVGHTNPSEVDDGLSALPDFTSSIPLRGEPSRLATGTILGEDGAPQPRVFVLGFKTGVVTIYDPRLGQVESRVLAGRGPQGLAIDAKRGLLYVAHFSDSYVSVVDIDKRHATYAQVVLNIGEPKPPVSSQ